MSDPIAIAARFESPGAPRSAEPHGSGHIHETWRVRHEGGAGSVLQRLNTRVFRNPEALMANLLRVTDHLRAGLPEEHRPQAERRVLSPRPAQGGGFHHRDDAGGFWRCFCLVEGARSYDVPTGPPHAREAARAFGGFLAATADLAPQELVVTIPHFHHLEKRAADLEAAAEADAQGRAAGVRGELETARRALDRVAEELRKHGFGEAPRRVVHNDCKINNVLMDDASGEGLCVIDLDTVMEGTVLYDFGDLVRTAACASPEDEVDLARMRIDPALLRALTEGYLEGAGSALGGLERELLPLSGPLMALENAVRFLTDHLQGDPYFRVHREGHNLDRARAQLRLVALLLEGLADARQLVRDAAGS